MAFVIEKGVPLTEKRASRKYQWDEMEPGDSVFFPGKQAAGARSSASAYAKKTGKSFSERLAQKDDIVGIRIWRIA